ncbi:MAG: cytochrome C oxidase subunit IV family protein [Candidatus Latescibacteria bacterium]|jgi:cytochrome c oxidase subunit 4|nr:cytochrome C oxidase subunit IV family protein [Candidatus Latescibacterota bacterium]
MSTASAAEVSKHVRVYLTVFVALAALTVLTVAVSYLHLSAGLAVLVALAIATVKGSLVAGYFMHLISEKRVIYGLLIVTVVVFGALILLPIFTEIESA